MSAFIVSLDIWPCSEAVQRWSENPANLITLSNNLYWKAVIALFSVVFTKHHISTHLTGHCMMSAWMSDCIKRLKKLLPSPIQTLKRCVYYMSDHFYNVLKQRENHTPDTQRLARCREVVSKGKQGLTTQLLKSVSKQSLCNNPETNKTNSSTSK